MRRQKKQRTKAEKRAQKKEAKRVAKEADITGSAIPTISAESSFNRRKTRVTTGSGDSPRAC
jgi:hypothetical protein